VSRCGMENPRNNERVFGWLHLHCDDRPLVPTMASQTERIYQLGRWLFELQQYDYDVQYRKGSLNRVADALSKKSEVCSTENTSKCGWYQRILAGVKTRPVDFPDYRVEPTISPHPARPGFQRGQLEQ